MKLTVVIPTLNEAAGIAGAIRSAVGRGVEIIVVDGGSTDGTAQIARESGARVISSAPGRACQLGMGARESSGDALVFLHADTQLSEGWDGAIRQALEDAVVVGGAFRFRFDRASPMNGSLPPTSRPKRKTLT